VAADFAKEPLRFVYENENPVVEVEFLPPDKYLGTRGPDCILFYQADDCVHIDDPELAEFYRKKLNAGA
jgi:hypothetical protein